MQSQHEFSLLYVLLEIISMKIHFTIQSLNFA